jgi:hypothetical protein
MLMTYKNCVQLTSFDAYGRNSAQQFRCGKTRIYEHPAGACFHIDRITLAAAGKQADAHVSSLFEKPQFNFIQETGWRFKAKLVRPSSYQL